MSADRKPNAFVDTQFKAQMGKFSPNGHWVAYVSNDSGRDEVYVVAVQDLEHTSTIPLTVEINWPEELNKP